MGVMCFRGCVGAGQGKEWMVISPIPSGSRSTVSSLVDRAKMPNELVQ
jgi:hypothetical protein